MVNGYWLLFISLSPKRFSLSSRAAGVYLLIDNAKLRILFCTTKSRPSISADFQQPPREFIFSPFESLICAIAASP